MTKVNCKEYIKSQYKNAFADFKIARTEEEQWEARKQMAELEVLASKMYGFEFSDSLAKLRK